MRRVKVPGLEDIRQIALRGREICCHRLGGDAAIEQILAKLPARESFSARCVASRDAGPRGFLVSARGAQRATLALHGAGGQFRSACHKLLCAIRARFALSEIISHALLLTAAPDAVPVTPCPLQVHARPRAQLYVLLRD